MLKALIVVAAVVPATAFLASPSRLPIGNRGFQCSQSARKTGSDRLALRMGWLDGFTVDKMYGAAPGSKVDQVMDLENYQKTFVIR